MACYPSALQSNAYLRKSLRSCWRTQHVADNYPIASILRYTITDAGNPAAGVDPTSTLVADLDDLPVAVDRPGHYAGEYRPPDFQPLREDERRFSFIDLIATPADTLMLSDFIFFEGRTWKPSEIDNDTAIGISAVRCQLVER